MSLHTKKSLTIGQLPESLELTIDQKLALEIPSEVLESNFKISVRQILDLVTKEYLGLDKVENTSDLEKPISDLVARALLMKAEKEHSHALSEINGLAQALSEFFNRNESIPLSNLGAVVELLENKANKSHTHQIQDIDQLVEVLDRKASDNHGHRLEDLVGYQELIAHIENFTNKFVNFETFNTALQNLKNEIEETIPNNVVLEMPAQW